MSETNDVRLHFDERVADYRSLYERPRSMWDDEKIRRLELTGRRAEMFQSRCVLDAGCGSGVALAELARRLPNSALFGLDISAAMLREAKKRTASQAAVIQGSAEQLPFTAGTFDLVVALGLLDYLRDHERFFAGVRRILQPQGYVIFTYPNANAWTRRIRDRLRKVAGRSETAIRAVPVKADRMRNSLSEAGFDLLEARPITYGNGLVALPWSRAVNRMAERACRWAPICGLLAWSCFCVARAR